jgi:hypothetical protein
MEETGFYSPPSCSRIICKPIGKTNRKLIERVFSKFLPSSFFNGFKRF